MLGRGTQPCGYCRKGGAGYIFLLIKYINHSMSEMKIIHSNTKSSTCASYGLVAALSAHKLVHLGRESATGQTEIFVSSALSPESHTTPSTSMKWILLKPCRCTAIFRPLPYMNHQDFQELLTYSKILGKKSKTEFGHISKLLAGNACL